MKKEKTMKAMVHYDLFIIGGGINGCGVARDAAGRGFNVGLAEMNDLASGTSSASTKLIHGGLRYLEHYEFRLVRKALKEREIIWRMAPHIVHPMRFILPYHKKLRSSWILRLGLFIYDYLGGWNQIFQRTKMINFSKNFCTSLKKNYHKGFEYSDAIVDDARLVIANARDAEKWGADIKVRTEVLSLKIEGSKWLITLHDKLNDKKYCVTASYIANMVGPWINHVLKNVLNSTELPPMRLVKGSHILIPKLDMHNRAYILQNNDNRIIFAIPYQEEFTLIGTTDCDYQGNPTDVSISDEEIDYICAVANEYFTQPILRENIIWTYSGVRPLYDDGTSMAQEITRDYVLKEIGTENTPKILNLYGGKITTYRTLAEDVMKFIEKALGPKKGPWTLNSVLPGGDFPYNRLDMIENRISVLLPDLDAFTCRRLACSYGSETFIIFANGNVDKGKYFGHGLYEIEVKWLMEKEWAKTCEDILWRRSKLGLFFTKQETDALAKYIEGKKENGLKNISL
ncbi:glycerol-3-phosphate dehydrogenase [Bartonella sp. Raccoon60]|uniref:glycerol-3-phosphate dehydrogenase n=1 Tax=Bartonella sp. Raccoon60 TaxID=1933912 RepID=UPI000999EEE8|nr:glycerol-3-phosphate dehydrogenase [Bartonella sp. Raccoon60]AQX26558.1 homodimeric glycerol 3-phosphate dehydrogenase (quinone) [Bartonella sp. Raccoon60]